MVEIINKIYTYDDALSLYTDVSVLSLPKRIWCDSKVTLLIICRKLAECQLYWDRQSNSHTLDKNGQWRTWNGNSWEKCDECEIVESVHELNIQEL